MTSRRLVVVPMLWMMFRRLRRQGEGSRRLEREELVTRDGIENQRGWKEDAPQKAFSIRAALSHSWSSVAGQKASRLSLPSPFALATLMAASDLGAGGPETDRLPQPNKLPVFAVPEEDRLSQEGRKAETRCMAAAVEGVWPLCRRLCQVGEERSAAGVAQTSRGRLLGGLEESRRTCESSRGQKKGPFASRLRVAVAPVLGSRLRLQ